MQESQSQPSSTSHRPRSSSARAAAAWSADSSSDDSRRWSDQLSLDEKDGFIFVNYSEGQAKMHPHAQVNHPHPSYAEARHYSKLKPGKRSHAQPSVLFLSEMLQKKRKTWISEGDFFSYYKVAVLSMLGEEGTKMRTSKFALSPPTFHSFVGYRWERQLVFRSKLTMHTAFDRKDNAHPAEITALGISK